MKQIHVYVHIMLLEEIMSNLCFVFVFLDVITRYSLVTCITVRQYLNIHEHYEPVFIQADAH